MPTNLSCPACGSDEITVSHAELSLKVPYGPDAIISEIVHTCEACGFAGDITGENHDVIMRALDNSNAIAAPTMIRDLEAMGITMRGFERALRLPMKTTNDWKIGCGLSPVVLALLRLIRTYPGLLEVADNNFVEPTTDVKV